MPSAAARSGRRWTRCRPTAAGNRAGVLRGAVAVGDRRAAAGAARHHQDPGPSGYAEAARRRCALSTSSPAHESPRRAGIAARPRRRLRPGGARARRTPARFEAYLAGSPEAQREVAEYREVAALLALAGPEAAPSADLRQRVLARVAESTRPSASPGARARGQGWRSGRRSPPPPGPWFGLRPASTVRGLRRELARSRELLTDTRDAWPRGRPR